MHFQLPQTLAAKVAEYDPALKPIIQAAKKTKDNAGATRMTLGVPTGLLPAELLTAEEQKYYAVQMNELTDKERAIHIVNDKGSVLLMHKSSVWLALWHWYPTYLEKNPKDYLFGCTIAHKNTPATLQRVSSVTQTTIGRKNNEIGNTFKFSDLCVTNEATYGRNKMTEHTLYVTADLILQGLDVIPGADLIKAWGRGDRHKRSKLNDWRNGLGCVLNKWEDEGNLFTRIKEQNDVRRCIWPELKADDNRSFSELALEYLLRYSSDSMKAKLDTPFFRKEINKTFSKCLSVYLDPENSRRRNVAKPWCALKHQIGVVKDLLALYPEATVDHCQQVHDLARHIQNLPSTNKAVRAWINANLPIASFIQILDKEVTKQTASWEQNARAALCDTSSISGLRTARLQELDDTFDMLAQLHYAQTKKAGGYDEDKPLELAKPSRWRITEFHDYVSAECFKLATPNEKLHQDLFPEPVKVDLDDQRWSFFQPQDVHQLAAWGRTVRNCVGNADTYRKGIKSKTHFIVLAMIDNVPRFTIQLKLNDGNRLNVDQIADTCNRRLSEQEKDQYYKAFEMALQQITPD